jgi:hypothetical protein
MEYEIDTDSDGVRSCELPVLGTVIQLKSQPAAKGKKSRAVLAFIPAYSMRSGLLHVPACREAFIRGVLTGLVINIYGVDAKAGDPALPVEMVTDALDTLSKIVTELADSTGD